MNSQPFVSILINNYNYGHFLQDAIDSCIAQTYQNKEIIVVDDGSVDDSIEVIASYQDSIIPIIKENGGQASAFNAGFLKSKGEIICFLDADDVFLPQKLSEVVKAFCIYQESMWCFHPLIVSNNLVHYELGDDKGINRDDLLEYDLSEKTKRGKLGDPLPFTIPATSGMCFRRSLMLKLLPMPETEGIILNDSYLKYIAMGISKGIALNKQLACQRIHTQNSFTLINDDKFKAITDIHTAYWMKNNFPVIKKFANNIFSVGLYRYKKTAFSSDELLVMLDKYLSSTTFFERLRIYTKSLLYKITK